MQYKSIGLKNCLYRFLLSKDLSNEISKTLNAILAHFSHHLMELPMIISQGPRHISKMKILNPADL